MVEVEPLADFYFAALPVVFMHCALITIPATIMSIVGGLLIYGTIIMFLSLIHI